jgi:putative secretion ATPase (PEP-CTERM system associated)
MYKNFYNLTQNPFQLNANLDFFFDSAGHKRAKAYLRYGLVQGEGFVVVTGMAGTGKTMLVKELFQSLQEDSEIIIGVMVTSQVGAEDTLRMLSTVFKLAYEYDENKAVLLARLEKFFKESGKKGKRVLLVVDEAQNLPKQSIEELRMLSNIEWDGKPILQIFLVGQEELGRRLYSPGMDQVKQRIVATHHLKSIEKDEIKQYIIFRLSKAGWKNNPQFEEEIFSEIYNYTDGIPRRINTLCDRLLLYGYLEELNTLGVDNVKHVISEIEADYQSMEGDEQLVVIEEGKGMQTPALTSDQDQRLNTLEKKVIDLTKTLNKERALLRKAILIQLDIDDAYD